MLRIVFYQVPALFDMITSFNHVFSLKLVGLHKHLGMMTGYHMRGIFWSQVTKLRVYLAANVGNVSAAGMEAASGRWGQRVGEQGAFLSVDHAFIPACHSCR